MQSTEVWPLKNQVMTRYYFGLGETTGKVSINNGVLDPSQPTDSQAFDSYTVDYSTTTGTTPHWTGLGLPHKYPNMRSHDAKSLTYTTPPLSAATNIVGHPVIHLWLSTEVPDLDAFAYTFSFDDPVRFVRPSSKRLLTGFHNWPVEHVHLPFRAKMEPESYESRTPLRGFRQKALPPYP